jgi:hypothetical protein
VVAAGEGQRASRLVGTPTPTAADVHAPMIPTAGDANQRVVAVSAPAASKQAKKNKKRKVKSVLDVEFAWP